MRTGRSRRGRARVAVAVVVAATLLFACQAGLGGWSSVIPRSLGFGITAFATHEYFNELAYAALVEHPAVKSGVVKLPTLEEIQNFSSIDQGQNGNGPDNPALTSYSWHWYNPERGVPEGATPAVVARYFHALKNVFLTEHLLDEALVAPAGVPRGTGANQAAYAAHFIQDMTCSFHVVGYPIPPEAHGNAGAYMDATGRTIVPGYQRFYDSIAGLAANEPWKARIAGPFRTFSPAEWRQVFGLALTAFHYDEKADWFDPNYYDGGPVDRVKLSGHFVYEAAVEVSYKRDAIGLAPRRYFEALAKERGYHSPLWRNDQTAEEFTRAMARETRARMVPGSRLVPDSRVLLVLKEAPVPYDDWWRAVQATYTVWRAAFSALSVGRFDLKLVKVPDGPDVYDLQVVVHNLEPLEAATNISVEAAMPGRGFSARADVGTVAAGDSAPSDWTSLGRVRLEDPGRTPGRVRLTVKGRYAQTPDAGEAIFEYPIAAIVTGGGFTLENMKGWLEPRARAYLTEHGLIPDEAPAEARPQSVFDQDTVESHVPAGGATVTKGQHVQLRVFGRYLVAVPNLVKPALGRVAADQALRRVDLAPVFTERETEQTVPLDQVVAQDPAPGTMVPPRSEVEVWVAKHRAAPQPQPSAPVPVAVRSVDVSPRESTVRLDQTAALSAIVRLADGSDADDVTLGRMRFEWLAVPASSATIDNRGPTAILTPRVAGPVQVMLTAVWTVRAGERTSQEINFRPATAIVRVLPLPREAEPAQPPVKPPTARDEACTRLERLFKNALAGRDVKTATAILAEAKDCPFAKEGFRALDLEKDRRCRELWDQAQAALRANDRGRASQLLDEGRALGCDFPTTAPPETGPSHELEGLWKARRGGITVRFRKIAPNVYSGVLESNPENRAMWVKPGEEAMRATRTGEETYRLEWAEYSNKMVSPGRWVRDDNSLRWLWGDRTFRVMGDEAGYDTFPVAFDRIKSR